jgi:glycerol-3-phosphate dehydrogenase (NAD(P)+)
MDPAHPRVTLIGTGSMGTVMAALLASRGVQTTVWGRRQAQVDALQQTRVNAAYLPGHRLDESIHFTSDPARAFAHTDLIVSSVPTQHIRATWASLAPHVPADTAIGVASMAKGIEQDTLLRPTQIIAQALAQHGPDTDTTHRPLASISGPTVADELARNLPATAAAAAEDEAFAQALQQTFTTDWFRVYTNTDLLGVELAGATKNVIALAAGMLDGLQAGINAKSALLARGLAEITRLGLAMGAEASTFSGLTGVGDLATTCFSPTGRNRTCGEALGRGRKLDDVLEQMPGIVEGVPTTRSVLRLCEQHDVEMPITAAVHDVLFEGLDPLQAISQLMSRDPKAEGAG